MSRALAEVLNGHLANRGWSFEKLAEAANLPRNTVYRWTEGEVSKVRHWQDLVRVAKAFGLNRIQTNTLLGAGGHPPIDVLLERATDEEDLTLFSHWHSTTTHNLPQQLTSFVGRDAELERVTRVLSSARLVTLTGPGGSGKTRLALEVAHLVLDEFDGAFFVDLSGVREPEHVVPTISRTLGLREAMDESPLTTLASNLRDRSVLLVLDNFEQVIAAAALVVKLLEATRLVKVLVTSRARLDVRGEHEIEVYPLSLPNPMAGPEELARNPAVVLFANRAVTADSRFHLTSAIASLVANVCVHLEGLPLGIELTAARTRQVELQSMLDQFPSRLTLASRGPRDVPERQRTLRATIAWSYDLLEPREQQLFNLMAVFVGGFTYEAARAVCSVVGQVEVDVLEGLESLVEQSLLRRELGVGDTPRYAMLETIREYASEKLNECGEVQAARTGHAEYCLWLAERADLEGGGQTQWMRRLAVERHNFQAALGWCREQGLSETGLRLSVALMPLWQYQGQHREARSWLDVYMEAEVVVSPALRARGLLWQGLLRLRGTGDELSASRYFEEALSLFRLERDLAGTSETLQAEADIDRNQGDIERASQRYVESLELAMQADNANLVAHGYMGLAFCAQEDGQFETAQRYWELTLEWAERSGNTASVALALNSLGEMARYRGDWFEAENYYEQTRTLAMELGNDFRMALALHNLGYVALYQKEPKRARNLFVESLLLYERQLHRKGLAECLAGLGRVEASEGRPTRAAALCGASEALLENMRTRLDTLDRADYERTLAALRNQLGERLETHLDEGRSMSMKRAVEYAVF